MGHEPKRNQQPALRTVLNILRDVGYPNRILTVSAEAAKMLQERTLTNHYNERPTWLNRAHRALDAAVAAAYGWPADLPDEEVFARLFALNQERALEQGTERPLVITELKKVA